LSNIHAEGRFAKEKGFTVKPDGDKGYRRVVPSPAPVEVLEARAIQVSHCPIMPGYLCKMITWAISAHAHHALRNADVTQHQG